MNPPDIEQMVATVAIQQVITAWANELDRNEGLGMRPLLADDCAYMARGVPRHGPDEVARFYADRLAELRRSEGRPPTQRHVVSNFLTRFEGSDHARVDFLLIYFASPDAPPVTSLDGPAAVADCWMTFSRGDDGAWRIATFDSEQSFVRPPR